MARVDLTVLIPVLNERDNLTVLLPRLARVLGRLGCASEVVVVDGGSADGTAESAAELGARVVVQREPGYGGALREGFAAAAGEFVLTLDADLSHDPDFIAKLWRARDQADIVIASRYAKGGVAFMPWERRVLSGVLNRFFAVGLGLPVRDMSSGFRLHRRGALADLKLSGRNFEIIEEVLVKAYAAGWRVLELPFTYFPRHRGSSHARIVRFGIDLLKAFGRLWGLRNSIESADYDERAFYSRIRCSATGSASATASSPQWRAVRGVCSTWDAARASSCRASTTPSASTCSSTSSATCGATVCRSSRAR
jgi:dolichol-phosphate mannosyltransferase